MKFKYSENQGRIPLISGYTLFFRKNTLVKVKTYDVFHFSIYFSIDLHTV